MSLSLLLKDEMNGFYRSRLMLVLWFGLPLTSLLLYLVMPSSSLEGLPMTVFTAMMVSSIGALLASVMLAVNLVNDINDHVLDLFLVRPVKKWHLLVSKFMAIYICVSLACLLALGTGIIYDMFINGASFGLATLGLADSLATTLMMIAVSCTAAVLISSFSPTVLIAVILVIFGGNQLSVLALLPLLTSEFSTLITVIISLVISSIMLVFGAFIFQRREL